MTSLYCICPSCGACFHFLHLPVDPRNHPLPAYLICPICRYLQCLKNQTYETVMIVRTTIREQHRPEPLPENSPCQHKPQNA